MSHIAPKIDQTNAPKVDYLDEDSTIRGQNYVCLSFISPEDLLKEKEVLYFEKFVKSFTGEMRALFDALAEAYPEKRDLIQVTRENNVHLFDETRIDEHYRFFKQQNSETVEREFHEEKKFCNTVRGIKVRGTFDTLQEAKNRADLLKRQGDRMDIFVAQVGVWCAWSPNPNDIANQEWANAEVNKMMKQLQENMSMKDTVFEERKRAKLEDAAAAMQTPDVWAERMKGEASGDANDGGDAPSGSGSA